MKRKEKFAGSWYPSDRTELEKLIKVTPMASNKDLFGVVPHAGLYYSSSLIKLFFSYLSPKINKIILITPSHYYGLPSNVIGSGKIESYESSLGDIPGFTIPIFETGYEKVTLAEHAVEMIIPFIAEKGNVSLCCAHVNNFTDAKIATEYARNLLDLIDDKTAVIASSDFTHYGNNFNYMPYGYNVNKEVLDKVTSYDANMALLFANGKGASAYVQAVYKDKSTICGIAPMLVVSEMARIKSMKGRVLGQSNSIQGKNYENNFVSYVSIAWR